MQAPTLSYYNYAQENCEQMRDLTKTAPLTAYTREDNPADVTGR